MIEEPLNKQSISYPPKYQEGICWMNHGTILRNEVLQPVRIWFEMFYFKN